MFTAWQDPKRGYVLTVHETGCRHISLSQNRDEAWELSAVTVEEAVEEAGAEFAEPGESHPSDWVEVAPCARDADKLEWVRTMKRDTLSRERIPGPWHIQNTFSTWCGRKPLTLTSSMVARSATPPNEGRICAECVARCERGDQRRSRGRGRRHA